MGASSSSNYINSVTNIVTNISNNIINSQNVSSGATQIISISNTQGNVIISGNQFNIQANVNMTALLSAISDQNVRQDLEQQIGQVSKSLTKGLNLANIAISSNDIEDAINDAINISVNVSQTCATELNNLQQVNVNLTNGNVTITNNSFNIISNIISNCVTKSLSSSNAISSLQEKLDQSASSTTSGISIGGIALIILGVLVLFIGAPVAVPLIAGRKNPWIYGLLIMLIGGILLLVWNFWTKNIMSSTLWSQPLDDICYPSDQLSSVTNIPNYGLASSKALNTKNCVGYFFQANQKTGNAWNPLNPPKTIFYKTLDKSCLPKQDDSPILTFRKVYFGNKDATGINISNLEIGDYFINITNATFQIYQSVGSFKSVYWSAAKKFDNSIDSINNIDIPNKISTVSIFKNKSTGWNLQSDSNLYKLNFTLNTDTKVIDGPGLKVSISSIPNASGIVLKQKKSWLLYTGIIITIVGILLTLYLILKKPKTTDTTEKKGFFSFFKKSTGKKVDKVEEKKVDKVEEKKVEKLKKE